jgi:uncharacterized membrane protein
MDDRYDWAGLYHDPDDPRLFVPKRNPSFGWTINLEHRYGRSTLTLIIMAVVVAFVSSMVANFYWRRPWRAAALTSALGRKRTLR